MFHAASREAQLTGGLPPGDRPALAGLLDRLLHDVTGRSGALRLPGESRPTA